MTTLAEETKPASTSIPEELRSVILPIVEVKTQVVEPQYSTFSELEKKLYVYIASCAAFASPVASAIYYPVLNILAADLHTTLTNINLTITTYMVGVTYSCQKP